jgi:hypothetical protein
MRVSTVIIKMHTVVIMTSLTISFKVDNSIKTTDILLCVFLFVRVSYPYAHTLY